ncbi:hypothetical protein FF100_27390 [Methylobacterium terricola]|uniref:Uncharacterized protein n=1 Tax=Methylobacterium terricola TaxID=2583531 RepID=A0A5C4LBM6_9HYPH|nr:hypothetical protein [Methylobacterium terricola]TNC09032.1 hypothetical protein FF100_27390 [Methylobacterium terricola]
MSDSKFVSSPLITPERLKGDRQAALSLLPDWAQHGVDLGDDIEAELSKFVVIVHGKGTDPITVELPLISTVILCELTRHGNSIVANPNRHGGEVYVKLSFARHAMDTMPISRIILNATEKKAVRQWAGPGKLDPDYLELAGAGNAKKAARAVAVKHAVELARDAGADAAEYEANLGRLFLMHDELVLKLADY